MQCWAVQEEYLLALAISAAVSVLIVTLTQHNAQDYVFAGFFLICSTCFLKLNWLRGAVPQLIPLLLVNVGCALSLVPCSCSRQTSQTCWAEWGTTAFAPHELQACRASFLVQGPRIS